MITGRKLLPLPLHLDSAIANVANLRCLCAAHDDFAIALSGKLPYNVTEAGLAKELEVMVARKEERIEARVPAEVKQRIEYAAELQGRRLTDFVTAVADERACAVIEQHRVVRLSVEDSQALAEAILNPPVPSVKAVAAARRYKAKMGK